MNWEIPDGQAGFKKGRGTRDRTANICWIIEKAREFQKNIYIYIYIFINYVKIFDFVDHTNYGICLKEVGIPEYLNRLLRNLYAPQEATVRTRNGTTDWLQIGKGVRQSVYFHPAYSTCEMQGWMKHKLESRLLEELSIMSDMQMTPPLWQKTKN